MGLESDLQTGGTGRSRPLDGGEDLDPGRDALVRPRPEPPSGLPSDQRLVEVLYAQYGEALLRYVATFTHDHHEAEDVVQETLLRAWRNADALDPAVGSIRSWLYTVARRILIDRARARASRPVEEPEPEDTPDVPHVDDPGDAVVERLRILQALSRLSPEQRAALVEVYYLGRTVTEAAASLGVPPGTVKSRLYYGLMQLRSQMKRERDVP